MGSIAKVFKKVTKAVTKPVSKAFKSVAKGIMKVGKATLRGVAKLQAKLGPLGSIAMAIAMPYALAGLSTGTTALMNSQNIFLKSIGTVGNQIRTGYQAFNAGVSKTFSTITNSISKGFQKFAPKGTTNIFSKISEGAKNLFNSAKNISKKYSPIKGTQGTVQVSDMGYGFGETTSMTSAQAAKALELGTIQPGQLSQQTLGTNKWFLQGSKQTDSIITDTINEAYKNTTSQYNENALRYFNDLKTKSQELGTYINDSEIGNVINNVANTTRGTDGSLLYDVDLIKTGDYDVGMSEKDGLFFNGKKTYRNINEATMPSKLKTAISKSAKSYARGLLTPSDTKLPVSYDMPSTSDMTFETQMTGYSGTDIQGGAGGSLLTGVFSEADRNRIMNYYKNMNLLGSS
jgi:hypothetical protein